MSETHDKKATLPSFVAAAACCGGGPSKQEMPKGEALRDAVRARYAEAARQAAAGASGCGCGTPADNVITKGIYGAGEVDDLPKGAVTASLGCGNPTALAELRAGEIVLDLGSGGGIDVLLSAKRVGPTGKAYGLDMTDEMLALARKNQAEAGVANAEFLKGTLEAIPLPEHAVDVVISNCVINLSIDKRRALAEAFRVLKPGGRFAVSDVVVDGEIPAAFKKRVELWAGCLAGALGIDEFLGLLREVGFVEPEIEVTRRFGVESLDEEDRTALRDLGLDATQVSGAFCSAFVRARKP
jgi:arsenite methyltransferase